MHVFSYLYESIQLPLFHCQKTQKSKAFIISQSFVPSLILFILSKLSQLGNEYKILHPQFNSPLQLILAFHSH